MKIHFRVGQSALGKADIQALDEIIIPLKNQRGYLIEVLGFSVGGGSRSAKTSVQVVADSVLRYLVLDREVPAFRICSLYLGNEVLKAAQKNDSRDGGYVEIRVLKNPVEHMDSTKKPE